MRRFTLALCVASATVACKARTPQSGTAAKDFESRVADPDVPRTSDNPFTYRYWLENDTIIQSVCSNMTLERGQDYTRDTCIHYPTRMPEDWLRGFMSREFVRSDSGVPGAVPRPADEEKFFAELKNKLTNADQYFGDDSSISSYGSEEATHRLLKRAFGAFRIDERKNRRTPLQGFVGYARSSANSYKFTDASNHSMWALTTWLPSQSTQSDLDARLDKQSFAEVASEPFVSPSGGFTLIETLERSCRGVYGEGWSIPTFRMLGAGPFRRVGQNFAAVRGSPIGVALRSGTPLARSSNPKNRRGPILVWARDSDSSATMAVNLTNGNYMTVEAASNETVFGLCQCDTRSSNCTDHSDNMREDSPREDALFETL